MSEDKICRLMNSCVHHGPHNNRLYLMKLNSEDYPAIIQEINRIAKERGYSKSFAKVPARFKDEFLSDGYICEGVIQGMFLGSEDGYFLSKYFDYKRKESTKQVITEEILINAEQENKREKKERDKAGKIRRSLPPKGFVIRQADYSDSDSLSGLFSDTFETYPFPISDSSYIKKTMDEGIVYFGIWKGDNLLAASSSETDKNSKSVEMTDFATHNDYLGNGFAGILLDKMEEDMRKKGFLTAYTIARAAFLPVNLLFYRRGYRHAGTLVNNTNICGSFESMNLWCKKL
ncbi:MAG: putative beta-lysine N-acetyltransferase [Methanomicrobium sp.]|nr:putative beta-lysine N-acetyltransferase [Methanomicrobium sp.]